MFTDYLNALPWDRPGQNQNQLIPEQGQVHTENSRKKNNKTVSNVN